MKDILAKRTSLIDASGIRKVFALAAELKDPVNFSIGQPDFAVPDAIKAAAAEAVTNDHNSYTQTGGNRDLVEAIAGRLKMDYGWDKANVLVTSGVSGGLTLAFMALIDLGDEVIVADPYFVIYKHMINLLGGRCVFVDSYPDFKLPVEGIAEAITERTKLIILNSPANPTGAVYSEDEVKAIAEIARANDVLILSDEIYDVFCYEGKCPSIARYYENTLLLKGFSKTYAMTGWRMGYAAGRGSVVAEVIEQMTKIQQYTFVCAPAPFQQAAIAAMDCDMSGYVADYRQKRDMIYEGLRDKYEIAWPSGAFYAFVKVPGWADSATEFVQKAITKNLLVIPGNVFSEKDTHFRISYATTNTKIEQGVEILCGLAEG